MTECLGQGGRPCQEVGVERQGGRRGGDLAAGAQTNLISPDWKKLFGLRAFAQSHGIYYASWLDRFLSVIQSDAACIFFKARAEQTAGALPATPCSKTHREELKSPAHRGSTSRWGRGFRQTVSPP